MIWEPFLLALVLGLIVSAGLYFAYLWPSVEPLEEAAAPTELSAAPQPAPEAAPAPAPAPAATTAAAEAAPAAPAAAAEPAPAPAPDEAAST